MSISKPSARIRRLVALAAVVAVVAVGCSSSSEPSSSDTTSGSGDKVAITGVPGVTDDAIAFAAVGTNSNNPLGTCVLDCYVQGIQAYFDWRNSEGGVNGRQLELTTVLDDELSKNQEKALEVISADDTFGTFSATQAPTGWADLAGAGIPTYVWGIHLVEESGQPNIFPTTPPACGTCTSRQTAYVVQLAQATKVASLGYGVSQNSKDCANGNATTIEAYSSDIGGAEVVYVNDDIAFGMPNGIGPEVTAMKDAGADMILACLDLNAMKTIAQELERQGIRDQVTMYHPNTYNQDFVGQAAGLFDGDYVGVSFRPFEADAEGSELTQYHEWMAKNGFPETELAMNGWINADTAYTGLEAAGPDFDRQKVIDATNQITDYTAGGLIPTVDWTRQHDAPTQDDPATHGPDQACIALVQVEGGEFVVPGDPAKPWSCWPGDTWDWSEPTPTNFE